MQTGSSSAGWWVDVLTFEKLPSLSVFSVLNCAPRAFSSDSHLSIKLKLALELEVCRVHPSSKTEPFIHLQPNFSFVPFEIFNN